MLKLLDFFNPLAFIKLCTLAFDTGGDTPSQPTNQTVTQTNLPSYAKPYFTNLMDRAQALSYQPYTPYGGQRIEGFTDQQLALQNQISGMTTPGQFQQATQAMSGIGSLGAGAAEAGLNQALGYTPGVFSAPQISAPGAQGASMSAATSGYRPNLTTYQMQGARDISTPTLQDYSMRAATAGYNPEISAFQMAAPERVRAGRVGTEKFGQGAADYYMSPYAEEALAPAVREARLQGNLQKQAGMLGSIGRGTFGGARQALLQAEQERGTQRNISDIMSTGMERAYQNAQQAFQADQARALQAQQLNQATGLQAALANQQAGLTTAQQNLAAQQAAQQLRVGTGTQLTLANLSNEQQAQVQNLAAKLQTQGLSSENAMRAALANQQIQQQTGQQNLAAALSVQNLGTETGRQMALANLSNEQQAQVQNLAAKLQTQGLNAQQAMQAALANQQAFMTAQQQQEQANQYGAGLGAQLFGQGMTAAQQAAAGLGALGSAQQQADVQRYGLQQTTAAQEQQLRQNQLDIAYQDFLRQRDYPQEMLGFYSNMLRGLPVQLASTQQTYQATPSIGQQMMGYGVGALSLNKMFG